MRGFSSSSNDDEEAFLNNLFLSGLLAGNSADCSSPLPVEMPSIGGEPPSPF